MSTKEMIGALLIAAVWLGAAVFLFSGGHACTAVTCLIIATVFVMFALG